mgnify:CR=1 FL=1
MLLRRVLRTCWLMRASVSLRSDWVNCCCRLGLPWQQAFRWLCGWGCLVGGIVLGGGAAISECSQKLLSCLHVLLIPVNSCEGMRYSGSPAGPVSLQHNLGVASHCEIHYECQSRTRVPECFFYLLLPSSLSMRPVLGPTQCGRPAKHGHCVCVWVTWCWLPAFCDSNVM